MARSLVPALRLLSVAALFAPVGCAAAQTVAPTADPAPSAVATAPPSADVAEATAQQKWGIVIHGGAGTILRENMTSEMEAQYTATLTEALEAGHRVLAGGGGSLDAVVAAINVMEDSPLFNAGKGAVFTSEGTNELDAAIMFGPTREAGAVAGIKRVKNPIDLARLVMEESPHVMMAGEGAETFAQEQGVELVAEDYFYTEERWQSLQRARERERGEPTSPPGSGDAELENAAAERDCAGPLCMERKYGTVGAVALDQEGNLAAGTSTGGMTNKRFGRVGDVPVIGAGTYANERCGVSATGHGEFFIRYTVAHDICARMEYLDQTLSEAAEYVVNDELVDAGGEGGVIALDAEGNVVMPFNSAGMYRGYMGADGQAEVAIFKP